MHAKLRSEPTIGASLIAGALRLTDTPLVGWLLGLPAAVLGLLGKDMFTGIWLATGMLTMLDWYTGRLVAHKEARYDPITARLGWQSKLTMLSLLLIARGVEAWAVHFDLVNVAALLRIASDLFGLAFLSAMADNPNIAAGGVLSVLLCGGAAYTEFESVVTNRERLGQRPIPVLSYLFRKVRELESKLTPGTAKAE